MEVGGRWSEEAWTFLTLLAKAKARAAPASLQCSIEYCLLRRWSQMVAVAAQSAFAGSLLGEGAGKQTLQDTELPDWGDILCDREVGAEGPSKLL